MPEIDVELGDSQGVGQLMGSRCPGRSGPPGLGSNQTLSGHVEGIDEPIGTGMLAADATTQAAQDLKIPELLQMQAGHPPISGGVTEVQSPDLLTAHDVDPSHVLNNRHVLVAETVSELINSLVSDVCPLAHPMSPTSTPFCQRVVGESGVDQAAELQILHPVIDPTGD